MSSLNMRRLFAIFCLYQAIVGILDALAIITFNLSAFHLARTAYDLHNALLARTFGIAPRFVESSHSIASHLFVDVIAIGISIHLIQKFAPEFLAIFTNRISTASESSTDNLTQESTKESLDNSAISSSKSNEIQTNRSSGNSTNSRPDSGNQPVDATQDGTPEVGDLQIFSNVSADEISATSSMIDWNQRFTPAPKSSPTERSPEPPATESSKTQSAPYTPFSEFRALTKEIAIELSQFSILMIDKYMESRITRNEFLVASPAMQQAQIARQKSIIGDISTEMKKLYDKCNRFVNMNYAYDPDEYEILIDSIGKTLTDIASRLDLVD